MSKSVVIVGASNQARETAEYLRLMGGGVSALVVDQEYAPKDTSNLPARVIFFGSDEAKKLHAGPAVLGVGFPGVKKLLADKWDGQNYQSVISPEAWVAESARIDEGSVVAPLALVGIDVTLGRHVLVNVGATVSHDCKVGDYSTVSPGCHVAGNVTIGAGVFVGIGATIIEEVTIGDGVMIAAGAVVTKDVPAGVMVAGVPAAVKRKQERWP